MDERSIDCLILGHHDQDRKVSAKSVTMRAMTLCKNLSGYRELLLIFRVSCKVVKLKELHVNFARDPNYSRFHEQTKN